MMRNEFRRNLPYTDSALSACYVAGTGGNRPMTENEAKKVVSCRMVRRAMGDETGLQIPMGASQGTVSGLGYSQSFTYGTGASGELYLTKQDKKLLGVSGQIGSYSPVEDLNV